MDVIDWPNVSDDELVLLWLHGKTQEIQDAAAAERERRNGGK